MASATSFDSARMAEIPSTTWLTTALASSTASLVRPAADYTTSVDEEICSAVRESSSKVAAISCA
jgi:hypothetical protein